MIASPEQNIETKRKEKTGSKSRCMEMWSKRSDIDDNFSKYTHIGENPLRKKSFEIRLQLSWTECIINENM